MAQQRMNVQAPIERLFARRWSSRAFAADKAVSSDMIASCLEAARWAPSCYGEEPWRFVVVDRFEDEMSWHDLLQALAEKNRHWAKNAPVLIVAAAEPEFSQSGAPNRWAEYDTGQATVCLCLQAAALGLASHQMGGFDAEAVRHAVGMPEQLKVMSVTALGHPGDAGELEEEFRAIEQAPRWRMPIEQFVRLSRWSTPWQVPARLGWEARYQETPPEELPWFQAGLDDDFADALDALGIRSGEVLDLGCGPGTQAVALAARGFHVTASDISEAAVSAARKRAGKEGVKIDFHVDDILKTRLTGPFDLILDRGVFHCFSAREEQQAYLAAVRRLLKADGILLLKCFHKEETRPEGPPGRYNEEDIRRLFTDDFEIVDCRPSVFATAGEAPPKALFCILRKKAEKK